MNHDHRKIILTEITTFGAKGPKEDSPVIGMRFLAEKVSPDTYVNIMGQYRPAGKVSADKFEEINRGVTREEMARAYQAAEQAGLWRFDQRRRKIGIF